VEFDFSWQHVVDGRAVDISLSGMLIVSTALVLISSFIALLPRVLQLLAPFLPAENEQRETAPAAPRSDVPEPELLAAVGYAFHCEHQANS